MWNRWRAEHPQEAIGLSRADLKKAYLRGARLSEADLSQADLSNANLNGAWLNGTRLTEARLIGARLSNADLTGAYLSGAFLSRVDLSRANLSSADLSRAEFNEADFSMANLSGADLTGAHLNGVNLSRANLKGTNCKGAFLRGSLLSGANLSSADLSAVRLSQASLSGADLSGADLTGAHLSGADLSQADLSGANLSQADFYLATLIDANFNGATLTNARLWATQREGWSIQGIICEAAYWDKDARERTTYSPGEFERLYADHTKIVLYYEGGISPIEIATLPALIQRIEATHPGCILRLHSVQDAPGGATVTLVVEEGGGHTPAELKEVLQEQAKQLQAAQRYALEQAVMRQDIEHQLSQLRDAVFSLLLEARLQDRALQSPSQVHYLTTLFLDMHGFSHLGEAERKEHISMLRGLAQPMLQRGAAQFVNTWGDAIVACFADVNAGLRCASQLVTVLQAAGIQTRIGMSRGITFIRGNPLTNRFDIEGDSVNFAARLEPLAEPGEVLIDEKLRYDPEVKPDRFIFTRLQRILMKDVGDKKKGDEIECYTVKLVE